MNRCYNVCFLRNIVIDRIYIFEKVCSMTFFLSIASFNCLYFLSFIGDFVELSSGATITTIATATATATATTAAATLTTTPAYYSGVHHSMCTFVSSLSLKEFYLNRR